VRKALIAAIAALAVALVAAPAASAIDKVKTGKLRKGVTVDGILEHARAFQDIALANDGNRAATTPGYDASVQYVADRLRRAGYRVTLDPFNFPTWELNGPSTFQRTDVEPDVTYVEGEDYIVAQFSGAGEVSGPLFVAGNTVVPQPAPAGSGVSGCAPADFAGMPAGAIALIQRGTCPFTQKYQNALDAGAGATLIFNDGVAGTDGREAPIATTAPTDNDIPAMMISNDIGEALYNARATATVRIVVDATTTPNEELNVIADSPKGDKDRTIVVGAHLDSVEEGPGINDNGSGSGGILEIAEQVAKLDQKPRNRLRFAFWGAEESGLVGSTAYVADQVAMADEKPGTGIDQIEANLNFDMIGSPNFVRFVYDGDLSNSPPPPSGAPAGSGQIEGLFNRYFDRQGLAYLPTAFDGRSDYGPFIANGVAAGGLFTGAEVPKTAQQEAVFGGVTGLPFDPCYHQACDTFFNLNHEALDQMSDAAAHATWTLARSKSPLTSASAAKKKSKRGKAWQYKGGLVVR
jgi:Zn-dependent M28 family amino/carboxypeptidase